jgi:hypothetical protein
MGALMQKQNRRPIALSDESLAAVTEAVRELEPEARSAFLLQLADEQLRR